MDFRDFYQATSHRTLRYAYGLTGDLHQAQDVTQEAYARAWQRWRQVSAYDNIEAWLRLVVNRLVQDWWRHLRVRSRTRLEPPAPVPAPSEDAVMLAAALKQLPKAQGRALALFYLLDLPVTEIAAETGVSDNTVRSWLARGRAGLATRLRDEADAATMPRVQDVAEAGRRRRRTRVATTVTAAGLAVLVVLGIAMAVIRTKQPDHPVTPAPSATTLRRLGEPVPFKGRLSTLIADGRAFIAANDHETLQITALDANSGRLLWTQPVPGARAEEPELSAVPGALVVRDLIDPPSQSSPQRNQITVLDAATGVTRWNHELADLDGDGPKFGEYAVFSFAAAMMVNADSGAIRALDWRTGQTRWTLSGSGRLMMEIATRTSGHVDGISSWLSRLEIPWPAFYRAEPDGVLREYAVATGRPTGHVWRGVPKTATDRSFVFRGKLYVVTDTQLTTFDLGGDGPSVSYTAHPTAPGTRETVRLWSVQPCSGDAICLIDGGNPEEERGRNPYQIVMLRPGKAPATHDLDTDDLIAPVVDGPVYLARGDIFDSRLRMVKPAELAGTLTIGIDDGTAVLVQDQQPDDAFQAGPLHLWTFDPKTSTVVDLGGLTVESVQLAVGEKRLLAVTANGVELFAYQE